MKYDNDVKKLSQMYDHWLDVNHYKDKAYGFKIAENWQLIVGNTINNHTERIDVRLPKIYLKINNSSLKEILYTDRQMMIDKINTYVNSIAVKEIIFN